MFYYKKRFGQNFLIDQTVINAIIKHINPNNNQFIIEIGPGLGAITSYLLANCAKLLAIEIDRELILQLTQKFTEQLTNNKLILINKDVLKINFTELLNNYKQINANLETIKIVGNLPYNISTPLLFKLFKLSNITSMHFLLQKEVAERLMAAPGSHQYGKLSIMAQYHAKINIVFYIDAHSFQPAPKVQSAMVQFIPYQQLPYQANNYQLFTQIVTSAFCQRRKMISNSLKMFCTTNHLTSLGLNPNSRAEQLSIQNFIKISNSLNI